MLGAGASLEDGCIIRVVRGETIELIFEQRFEGNEGLAGQLSKERAS